MKLGVPLFFLTIIIFGLPSCDTSADFEDEQLQRFVKYYGSDGNQEGVDLIVNPDGTILMLGNSETTAGGKVVYLVKTDSEGEILWERTFGGPAEEARDIEPTNDGNFIIVSNVFTNPDDVDIKLTKVNSDGTEIANSVYAEQANQLAHSVTPLRDGGFVVTGATEYDTLDSPSPNNADDLSDAFHFRCNSSLVFNNFNWYEQYGGGIFDAGTKLFQASDNFFYVFGYSNQVHKDRPSGEVSNFFYYGINNVGIAGNVNFLFDRSPNDPAVTSDVISVSATLGGGFLMIGTQVTGQNSSNIQVARLRSPLVFDSNNDDQGTYTILREIPTLTSVSACESVVGVTGFILLANQGNPGLGLDQGRNNIWVTKIDQGGSVLWSSVFGSEDGDDRAAKVKELPDGRVIVLGTMDFVNNQTKMVLLKLNSNGKLIL